MESKIKKRKLNEPAIINTNICKKPNIYDMNKENNQNKCIICNIDLGENCYDQLCNKTYCFRDYLVE